MKFSKACLLLISLSIGAAAAPVDSRITAVTVYADRAVVTRVAEVTVGKAGPLEAEFSGLPVQVVDASLRVAGRGTAQATILDVSVKVAQLESAPSGRIKALEDEIAGLQRDRGQLADREGILDKQDGYLGQIAGATTQPQGKDGLRTTIDEWTKLLAFMDDQRTRIAKEREDLSAKETDMDAKIEARQRTLAELRGAGRRSAKDVVVRLDAATAGKLDLTLSYALTGATWSPSYDARLSAGKPVVDLGYYGLVRNATGEDWTNVALTLSTAQPSRGGSAPELSPWIVDVYQPPLPRPIGSLSMEKNLRFGGAVETGDEVQLSPFGVSRQAIRRDYVSTSASASVAQPGLTSATFRVTAPATLKSDGSLQKVSIAAAELPVSLSYHVTPKLVETAFLSAKAKNTTDYPLLAGPLNAFLGDAFVATSRLKTVMPGEHFELALGADDGIAVKRRLVNRFTETVGITSSTTRVSYEFLITLTNTKAAAERVVVSEPVPVSRNEKIEVKLVAPDESDVGTPAAPKTVTREEGGKLVWRLDLKPGETREIPLKFRVEYPSSLRVTGLE